MLEIEVPIKTREVGTLLRNKQDDKWWVLYDIYEGEDKVVEIWIPMNLEFWGCH